MNCSLTRAKLYKINVNTKLIANKKQIRNTKIIQNKQNNKKYL